MFNKKEPYNHSIHGIYTLPDMLRCFKRVTVKYKDGKMIRFKPEVWFIHRERIADNLLSKGLVDITVVFKRGKA